MVLLWRDPVRNHGIADAAEHWVLHHAHHDEEELYLDDSCNHGLDLAHDCNGSVLYHLPMQADQLVLATVLGSSWIMSTSSAGTGDIHRLFRSFSNG